jgi:hypothetical protein
MEYEPTTIYSIFLRQFTYQLAVANDYAEYMYVRRRSQVKKEFHHNKRSSTVEGA